MPSPAAKPGRGLEMEHEDLIQAMESVWFVSDALKQANKKESAVCSLLILPLLKRAVELERDIAELVDALALDKPA